MTPKKRSLDEFVADHDQARFVENQQIRRELNAVRAEYGVVKSENMRLTTDLAALERIYDEAVALAPDPAWLKPIKARNKTEANQATLVAFLSDVHAGEVVRPEEMFSYNKFNLDICDARLRRFFDKTIDVAHRYFAGVTYDGIVLALGGDLVSGDIHDELAQTNELSVFDTTLWVAPRIVAGIEKLAEEFGRVHVVSAPGNHGRDSKKPRHKKRSAHNADTHIAKMVAYSFTTNNKSANVSFDIPESFDVDFKIYDYVFSMEHGDNLQKNNPGTAEIGALGPVKRGTLRKSKQHQEEGRPFHYNLVGHFHQYVPAPSQGFIMNGSVKGYDEFARNYHLKPEQPQQALVVIAPEHGVTMQAPILCGDRSSEKW